MTFKAGDDGRQMRTGDQVLYLTEREKQLIDAIPSLVITREQIVCGDCSGSGDRPARTLLTLAGCCSNCGGRSYELASVA